ncbi:MAG: hypothetical protein K9I47_00820 [Bacteroidales bacterium]|nr:hypothetical protein [Bacteroidales bacterium]
MKKLNLLLPLLVIALLSTSCDDGDDKDERDKFIGTWKGTRNLKVPEWDYEESNSVTYEIEKNPGTEDGIIVAGAEAYVNGNSYTYEDFTQTESSDGTTITIEFSGGGSIDGSVIDETGTVVFYAEGEEFNGSWSSTLNKQ